VADSGKPSPLILPPLVTPTPDTGTSSSPLPKPDNKTPAGLPSEADKTKPSTSPDASAKPKDEDKGSKPEAVASTNAPATSSFDTEQIHRQLVKSAVWIVIQQPPHGISFGSGTLVDKKNRLILTNHHVINDSLNSRYAPSVFFAEFDKGE